MKILLIYTSAALLYLSCLSKNKEHLQHQDPSPTLAVLMDSLHLTKENLNILIDKSDYSLYLLADSVQVKAYPVVFGTNPVDDKVMQGDRCTPEGHFKVRDFYPHSSWSKFIWIDYPTEDSRKKHQKAKLENRIPKDAPIGGEIGIHGAPKNNFNLISERVNWTWGCISLTNEDVNELYEVAFKGMAIEIRQ